MTGHPRGWFLLRFSSELGEQVLPLTYFGRALALYRDPTTKEPRLVDGHCPHLGAHLGHGGRVEDGALVCPFHGWRFGPDGRCVGIPYASSIPPKARLRSYPTLERNGLVFGWYARGGELPDWEIPAIPEFGDEGWTRWKWERVRVRTHPREIVENVVDIAHFVPVHQTEPHRFENEFRGHLAIQRSGGIGSEENRFKGDDYELTATYHGPGYQVTEFHSRGVEARLLNAHTRVDDFYVDLCFGVLLRSTGRVESDEKFLRTYVRDLTKGFQQDIAIWEHKRWRDAPVLADGDGDIGGLRRWYAQFYEDRTG